MRSTTAPEVSRDRIAAVASGVGVARGRPADAAGGAQHDRTPAGRPVAVDFQEDQPSAAAGSAASVRSPAWLTIDSDPDAGGGADLGPDVGAAPSAAQSHAVADTRSAGRSPSEPSRAPAMPVPFGEERGQSAVRPPSFAALADRIPARWRGTRFAVGRRGLIVLAVVGLAAAVAAGVGVARDSPPDVAVPEVDTAVASFDSAASGEESNMAPGDPAPGTSAPGDPDAAAGARVGPSAADTAAPAADAPEEIVVAVQGLVAHSGLVSLDVGARVAEALDAAGGPLEGADLLSLNLARKLADGDQILVGVEPTDGGPPRLGSATISGSGMPESGAGGAGGVSGGGEPIDLNSATAERLESLPGVGPVTAAAILDWRERNGRFASVDQLTEVKGIGPATLADLREAVTV